MRASYGQKIYYLYASRKILFWHPCFHRSQRKMLDASSTQVRTSLTILGLDSVTTAQKLKTQAAHVLQYYKEMMDVAIKLPTSIFSASSIPTSLGTSLFSSTDVHQKASRTPTSAILQILNDATSSNSKSNMPESSADMEHNRVSKNISRLCSGHNAFQDPIGDDDHDDDDDDIATQLTSSSLLETLPNSGILELLKITGRRRIVPIKIPDHGKTCHKSHFPSSDCGYNVISPGSQDDIYPAIEVLRFLCDLANLNIKTTSRTGWEKQESNKGLLDSAMEWLMDKKSVCTSEDDFINHGSWFELISGVDSGKYFNCFIGGNFGARAFIDSEMTQFAGMQWLIADNHFYLVWLGYARLVFVQPGSSVLHAEGPLYKIPPMAVGLSNLGTVWSVGARPRSIPTAADYARLYASRIKDMKDVMRGTAKNMDEKKHSILNFPSWFRHGKVRSSINHSSYSMLVGEEAYDFWESRACVVLSVLCFTMNGLVLQKLRRFLKKNLTVGINPKTFGKLEISNEDADFVFLEDEVFRSPLRHLELQFRKPEVKKVFANENHITASDLALMYTLAAAHTQIGCARLSGEGICPVGHNDRSNILINGPLSIDVLVASGWSVCSDKIYDWNGSAVNMENFALSSDMMSCVPVKQMRCGLYLVCKRHISDEQYWNHVLSLNKVLLIDNDEERNKMIDKVRRRYEEHETISGLCDVHKMPLTTEGRHIAKYIEALQRSERTCNHEIHEVKWYCKVSMYTGTRIPMIALSIVLLYLIMTF